MNKSDFYSSKTFEFALDSYLINAFLKYEDKILVYRLTRGTKYPYIFLSTYLFKADQYFFVFLFYFKPVHIFLKPVYLYRYL